MRHFHEAGAKRGKRVRDPGGATNHTVVMPDTKPKQTVDAPIFRDHGSASRRCIAVSVAVLVGDIGSSIVPLQAERVEAPKVENGLESGAEERLRCCSRRRSVMQRWTGPGPGSSSGCANFVMPRSN